MPSAVHFGARVSGPPQHTWPGPPQVETHLLVVVSQPSPCWQLTSGPKAGTFWNGARQRPRSRPDKRAVKPSSGGSWPSGVSLSTISANFCQARAGLFFVHSRLAGNPLDIFSPQACPDLLRRDGFVLSPADPGIHDIPHPSSLEPAYQSSQSPPFGGWPKGPSRPA